MSGLNVIVYLAGVFTLLLGYWFGRFIQKHWPHRHLRPWKWRDHRD